MAELAKKLKTVYEVKGEDGVEAKYAVLRPNPKVLADGQTVYNRAFKKAVDNEAIVRAKLDDILRKQKLWDDDKQAQLEVLNGELIEAEKLLGRGYRMDGATKVAVKMSEAKAAAINMRKLRDQKSELLQDHNNMDGMTAEAQAENARFNYFVSKCVVYNQGENEGKPVFKDVDDYLERANEACAFQGAMHMMVMIVGGSDPDWKKKLPENKFLVKHGFVDDKLRLIDPMTKRLVDSEGRLINEDGRYVNEQGQFLNRSGERIDENGDYVFDDAQEFINDMGLAPEKNAESQPVQETKDESGLPWIPGN